MGNSCCQNRFKESQTTTEFYFKKKDNQTETKFFSAQLNDRKFKTNTFDINNGLCKNYDFIDNITYINETPFNNKKEIVEIRGYKQAYVICTNGKSYFVKFYTSSNKSKIKFAKEITFCNALEHKNIMKISFSNQKSKLINAYEDPNHSLANTKTKDNPKNTKTKASQ